MNLNPEQKKAVEQTGGSVMVIAGAGTGKTRVIIHRIAHLINNKNVNPENILALTFSNKAAEEMRLRTEEYLEIPLEEMHISTFHSFCQYILQEYGSHIGISPGFKVLDEINKKIILRNLFPGLKLHYYLLRYDPTATIDEFNQFISRAKDELIDPSEYNTYTKKLRKEFELSKGDLPESDQEATALEVQRIEESAKIYEAYREELARNSALDFGDLILCTYQLFNERPNILREIQRRFSHILVDEFQDTNAAQIELLYQLAKENKNICVVGDDDQAIYRFRGASYASFKRFRALFPGCKEITLKTNYRSTKNILDCSAISILKNASSRLFPQKILKTIHESGAPVRLIITASNDQEASIIADLLQKRIEKNKQQGSTESIAVLYRAHVHNKLLVEECLRRGIPCKMLTPEPLFKQTEIKLLISYMRILDDSDDFSYMYTILQHSGRGMSVRDIAALFDFMQMQDYSPLDLLMNKEYYDILPPEAAQHVTQLRKTVLELYDESTQLPAVELFKILVQKIRIMTSLLLEPTEVNDRKVKNISRFYRFIIENTEDKKDQSLHTFMKFLDHYILAGGDPGMDEELDPDPNSVNFLTVHAAKGLEFDTVYLIGLSNRRFPIQKRSEVISFPQALMKEEVPEGDVHTQEERRLFYVALTRARTELTLSTVQKKRVPISKFVKEIIDDKRSQSIIEIHNITEQEEPEKLDIPMSSNEVQQYRIKKEVINLLDNINTAESDNVPNTETIKNDLQKLISAYVSIAGKNADSITVRSALKELSESFEFAESGRTAGLIKDMLSQPVQIHKPLRLSFSQIDTYQTCPMMYKFRYIFKVQAPKTAPPTFGQVIHKTLQHFYLNLINGKKADKNTLLELYENFWESGCFEDKMQELSYKKKGEIQLINYYEKNKDVLRPPLYLEKRFLMHVDDITIDGKIDRIDDLGSNKIEIIDYKTGKPKDQKKADRDLQMSIYAAAIQNILPEEKLEKLTFYYLDNNESVSTTRTKEQLEETFSEIKTIADDIREQKFALIEGYHCNWCAYQWICPAKQPV